MSAEPEDLLGKADALMARNLPGRAPAAPYPDIPVLDEVVDGLAEHDDVPLLTEYLPDPALDEAQIEALAASIRAALLEELQPKIDALIAARVRDVMAPMVGKLFADLRGGLQEAAREILSDAIQSAVKQELERRKPRP